MDDISRAPINHNYIISVIVPVFNAEKYLARCVESILNQTFQFFELLLVDDGSTDASSFICDSYKYDERVQVIHQANQGVSAARNNGIDNASGDYIVFVDSDDFLEPNAFDVLLTYIGDNAYDLVCGSFQLVFPSGMRCSRKLKREDLLPNQLAAVCYEINFDVILGSVWGKLYRKDIIQNYKIRFPSDISYAEDNIFNIQYYRYIKKAILLDNVVYNYFYNENSLTTTIKNSVFIDFIYVSKEREKYFKSMAEAFDHAFFAGQMLSTLLVSLRRMESQYSYEESVKKITELLTNDDIAAYIKDSKPNRKYNLLANVFIVLCKINSTLLLKNYLFIINYLSSIKMMILRW